MHSADRRTRPPRGKRREQILDEAVRLFSAKGYARASLREIADAVGIQKASLYHHFPSKELILVAIHERFMDVLFERAERRQAGTQAPDALLAGFIEDLLHLMPELRPYIEVFFRERYELGGDVWRAVARRRRAYEQLVVDAVRAGVADGTFRADLDPRLVTYGVFGVCNWSHQWFDPDGEMPAEGVAEQYKLMLIEGLRAPAAEANGHR